MKAIDLLKGICAECIDLEGCYTFKGDVLQYGGYARLLPLNRDSILDGWFKWQFDYFCRYSEKDHEYCFLPQPALRAQSTATAVEVIDFWIIEK